MIGVVVVPQKAAPALAYSFYEKASVPLCKQKECVTSPSLQVFIFWYYIVKKNYNYYKTIILEAQTCCSDPVFLDQCCCFCNKCPNHNHKFIVICKYALKV